MRNDTGFSSMEGVGQSSSGEWKSKPNWRGLKSEQNEKVIQQFKNQNVKDSTDKIICQNEHKETSLGSGSWISQSFAVSAILKNSVEHSVKAVY